MRLTVECELSDPRRWTTFATLLKTWFPSREEVASLRGHVDEIRR